MHSTATLGKFDQKRYVSQAPKIRTGAKVGLLARQMGDLYSECIRQVISDDEVKFHVVMMPEMSGSHFVFSANVPEEEDFADGIEAILGIDIGPDDCIVLLGQQMLQTERNEDEMMEIVLADVALHLDRLWPVTDATAGWMGRYIGVASIASIIACSHDVLKMMSPADAIVTRIKDMATKAILNDVRVLRFHAPHLEMAQNRQTFEAIELVCDNAFDTQGCYLTLPVTARTLRNTAKSMFLEVVDGMSEPLRTLI